MKVAQTQENAEGIKSALKGIPPEDMRMLKNRSILIADRSQRLYQYISKLLIPISPDQIRRGQPDWRTWLMNRPGSASLTSNISNLLNDSKNLVNTAQAEDPQGLKAAVQKYRQSYDRLFRSNIFPLTWWRRGETTPYPALYVIGESLAGIEAFLASYAQKMQS